MKTDTEEFAEKLEKLYRLEHFTGAYSLPFDELRDNEMLSEALSHSAIPGLIGKKIKVYSNQIYCDANKPVIISYIIKSKLISGEILIADKFGNIVKEFELSEPVLTIGIHELIWDCVDSKGKVCPEGVFTVFGKCCDNNNLVHDIKFFTEGEIGKVLFSDAGVNFKVNNLLVQLDEVFHFSASESGYI